MTGSPSTHPRPPSREAVQAVSTRGRSRVELAEAILGGLAPDRGLYLPAPWPDLPPPPADLPLTPGAVAGWAAPRLLGGLLPADALAALAREALDFPVPLAPLGPLRLLELFHGPTLAFKDVGARFLARLWGALDDGRSARTVLVATSGDTGGAVAQACHRVQGLRVVVLFPQGRVSTIQRRQFTTLGDNVTSLAVGGPFDRCQALVKGALAAPGAAELGLTSANSINLGRLVAQVFYYLHLARLLGWGRGGATQPGSAAGVVEGPVVVPSGNLGNLTAGLLAARAGAPLGPWVAACNANRTLVRFLEDGRTRGAPTLATLSTAMDVGRPSNLERMEALLGTGPRITARSVDDEATREAMRWALRDLGVLLDPHTAVGVAAARALIRDSRDPRLRDAPPVVLATAHPAKFPGLVEEVTGVRPEAPLSLARSLDLPEAVTSFGGGVPELLELIRGLDGPGGKG